MPPQSKLGPILVKAGLLRPADAAAIQAAQRPSESFADAAARTGLVSEDQIAEALARHYGLPFLRLAGATFDPRALAQLTEAQATGYRAIPVTLEDGGRLLLAVADPADWGAKQAIEFQGLSVRLAVATPTAIRDAIAAQYRADETLDEILRAVGDPLDLEVVPEHAEEEDAEQAGVLDLFKRESRPVVKTVNVMLRDAIERRASDVHVEPGVAFVRVRFRIDGVLEEALRLPKWVQSILVARLKVLASLDIAERRVPQDGRFRLRQGSREVDVRISTLPTHYGEKVVLRLLDPERVIANLDDLGFEASQLKLIRETIAKPQGMILATGPTGSGKSSTLFASLREVLGRPLNIVTIENPIEYDLAGVTQVQVNEKAGLTFAATLRSILRQDPNVLLIGEIRDQETAEIALQASMTGHLVLSTLHTRDAPSAVTRLLDLGVAPFVLSSSLTLVIAQRLVRRICESCRRLEAPPRDALARLGLAPGAAYYRGAGCEKCNGTGFRGRTVVAEVLPIDGPLREAIASRESESAIRKALRAAGQASMIEDAARKVRLGITTADEVLRVVEIEAGALLCEACGEALESDYAACPSCGASLRASCAACRQPLKPSWAVCPYCRTRVAGGALDDRTLRLAAPPLAPPAPPDAAARKAEGAPAPEGRQAARPVEMPPAWFPSAAEYVAEAARRPESAGADGAAEAGAGAGTARGAEIEGDEGQTLRILVVDDDPDIRRLVSLLLKRLKYRARVETAANGSEALARIAHDPPALVLLDIRMPEVDGLEVCRQLRADLATAFIPVLMMTASREEEMRAKAFQVGTDDYIPKPIDPTDFTRRVERLLARTYGI
jgi:type IV pilus assembly protein PilB